MSSYFPLSGNELRLAIVSSLTKALEGRHDLFHVGVAYHRVRAEVKVIFWPEGRTEEAAAIEVNAEVSGEHPETVRQEIEVRNPTPDTRNPNEDRGESARVLSTSQVEAPPGSKLGMRNPKSEFRNSKFEIRDSNLEPGGVIRIERP